MRSPQVQTRFVRRICVVSHAVGRIVARMAWLLVTFACKHDEPESTKRIASRWSLGAVRPAPDVDPCTLITLGETERILGPLDGQPRRVSWDESTTDTHGNSCVFPLASDSAPNVTVTAAAGGSAERRRVTVRLERNHAVNVTRQVNARARDSAQIDPRTGVLFDVAWESASGEFVARAGDVAVIVAFDPVYTTPATARSLAFAMLVELPDRPPPWPRNFSSNELEVTPPRDPCSALTQVAAERAIGSLILPPHPSIGRSALPHGRGTSCAYRSAGHAVAIVTPWWTDASTHMRLARLGATTVSTGGLLVVAGDTLKGPWDEIALRDGVIAARRGDRGVELDYGATRLSIAAAVGLVGLAIADIIQAPR